MSRGSPRLLHSSDALAAGAASDAVISRVFSVSRAAARSHAPATIRFFAETKRVHRLLVALARLPLDRAFEDERARAARLLILYLGRTHRLDLHARYVAYLAGLHADLGNATEAAISFLLHADVLLADEESTAFDGFASSTSQQSLSGGGAAANSNELLPAICDARGAVILPPEARSTRLNSILRVGLEALTAAGAWEEAVRLGGVLAARLVSGADFLLLGHVLRSQAALYEKISSSRRVFASYFVARFSPSTLLPRSVRGRTLILRGRQGEFHYDAERELLSKWKATRTGPPSLDDLPTTPPVEDDDEDADDDESSSESVDATSTTSSPVNSEANSAGANVTAAGGGIANGSNAIEIGFSSVTVVPGVPSDIVAESLALLKTLLASCANFGGVVDATGGGGGGGGGPVAGETVGASGNHAARRASGVSGASTHSSEASNRRRSVALSRGVTTTINDALHSPRPSAGGTSARLLLPQLSASSQSPSLPGFSPPTLAASSDGGGITALSPLSPPSFEGSSLTAPTNATKPSLVTSLFSSPQGAPPIANAPPDAAADGSATLFSPTPSPAWARLPVLIRQSREHSGARIFMLARPVKRNKTKIDTLDVWVARTYVVSRDAFPTTHRSSPVLGARTILLNPVEVAVVTLAERTADLMHEIEAAARGADRAAPQSFSQMLSGTIFAAVAGGIIVNYLPLFSGTFRDEYPEIAADLDSEVPPGSGFAPKASLIRSALTPAVKAHFAVLRAGAHVHERKCCAEMAPLHEHLVEKLAELGAALRSWGLSV